MTGMRVRGSSGNSVDLAQIATIRVTDGPTELRSENAQPAGYVLLDLDDADVGGVLQRAQAALAHAEILQALQSYFCAVSLSWVLFWKSLASCRSCNWLEGSPNVRLTIRPRCTAGRSSNVSTQR